MNITNFVRPLFIIMLVLGLTVGCASTGGGSGGGDSTADQSSAAEQAISDAKSSNARAKAMDAEWRDTGKIIASAEEALAAGDEAKAIELANKAEAQAENAMKQARAEQDRLAQIGVISADAMVASDQYEVSSGDNLWDISGKADVYADPYQWPLIYKTNRDKINDADLIYVGQVLDIDRDVSSSDVDAAVAHAKSRGAWSLGVTEASDEAYLAE